MQLSNILPLLLLSTTNAQTNVGCSSTCPPLGYESDSSHLCIGNTVDITTSSRLHNICHPLPTSLPSNTLGSLSSGNSNNNKLSLDQFKLPNHVTIIANYYTGCEAGRRESGVYAGIAQRIHDASKVDTSGKKDNEEGKGRINFVTSLKGGGNCETWASIYQQDALSMGLNNGIKPTTQPYTISDINLDLRDYFFTPPYPHPSYIILDENLNVVYKNVGPCCGYVSYYDCTDDVALGLDGMLSSEIYKVYDRQIEANNAVMDEESVFDEPVVEEQPVVVEEPVVTPPVVEQIGSTLLCQTTTYSDWSSCSQTCGDGGIQFRYRANSIQSVETRPCPTNIASTLPSCQEQCVVEFGTEFSTKVIANDLDSPRDLAFHPTPGIHLGAYSEGRTFYPNDGEELWIANGNNHSISIIASLGSQYQTTISRRDRGYYHYMNNITALAFNTVKDAPSRNEVQDTYNFFAVCNDNLNDYVGTKEPNYFMGPTLYDTDVVNKVGRKNTVNRIGDDCSNPGDECYFLHADMLHESPACIGIAHDPEVETAYGAVYWAFDTTGDNSGDGGQLVKFDFSQPHGPGSMDHSIAQVRRYPEIKLYRDESNAHGHAGMIVHPEKRILYIANPGKGTIVAVHIDTGSYSRTAREEYPIFSNPLPSFEYSIYECVDQDEVFASGLNNPSGLALSLDGTRLFVAERGGRILALEVDSGLVLQSIDVGYTSIGGLAISPETGDLYFVDMDTNQVVKVETSQANGGECTYQSLVDMNFMTSLEVAQLQVVLECGEDPFSLNRDYSCQVDATIPNGSLFEQVHTDTGYASDDPNVQASAGMDEQAALLENRTDCEYDSELNFDALLLGGYYCHVCLPRNEGSSCDAGGTCSNQQWDGFSCDNHYYIDYNEDLFDNPSLSISSLYYNKTFPEGSKIELSKGTTYRFTVRTGDQKPVHITTSPVAVVSTAVTRSAVVGSGTSNGPILLTVDETTPDCLYLTSPRCSSVPLVIEGGKGCPDNMASGANGGWELRPASSASHLVSFGGCGCAVLLIVSLFALI